MRATLRTVVGGALIGLLLAPTAAAGSAGLPDDRGRYPADVVKFALPLRGGDLPADGAFVTFLRALRESPSGVLFLDLWGLKSGNATAGGNSPSDILMMWVADRALAVNENAGLKAAKRRSGPLAAHPHLQTLDWPANRHPKALLERQLEARNLGHYLAVRPSIRRIARRAGSD